MEVEIKKIYKDAIIQPNFLTHGNFQLYLPECKMLIVGIEFTISESGKLKTKIPMKYFYYKDEETGKQVECKMSIFKFEKPHQVWESVRKALRKKLLADMGSLEKETPEVS